MTSIIKFTALSGGTDSGGSGKNRGGNSHCYLLQVDDFNFLLDCGWDSDFSTDHLERLRKHGVDRVDAVLLSYPDVGHLGALPYVVGKMGLSCPIYATVPVYKMGQMFLYDLFQARHNVEEFDLFSLDEVDKTFEMMTQVKYNQSIQLKGKGEGLTITPIPAGHMIGGSMWKIVKDGEEDIVYAVDFNHKKEQHLNGCQIERVTRPSLLITDAHNAKYNQTRRRDRDEELMTNILKTLRGNGNVLVCVDTAGRILELAHMVDHLWQMQDSGLIAYSVALLNNVSYNVIEFAKSQIEWMSEKLMRNFEGKRNNPFQFRHLKLCHSMSELNKVPSPKVVLASMPDLEAGFGRELFLQWGSNPRNSVILTSRTPKGTLARDLIDNGTNRKMKLEVKKRVKLAGLELEDFRRREREEAVGKLKNAMAADAMLDDESSSDEEMDVSTSGPSVKRDIIAKPEHQRQKSGHTGFFKEAKNKFPMYPYHPEHIKWDEYGEFVRKEEFSDFGVSAAGGPSAESQLDDHADGDKGLYGARAAGGGGGGGDDEHDYTEVPTKCVSEFVNLHVKAQCTYIDFEGRSDGESIKKVIDKLKPRRAIIVRGESDSCRALADYCRQVIAKAESADGSASGKDNVFIAKNGEAVDATTESFIYQMRLPELLVSRLQFSKGKDGMLSWVDGVVSYREEADVEMDLQKAAGEAAGDSTDPMGVESQKLKIPSLLPLPELENPGHGSVFVNELKLSDFKIVLTKNNINSEFIGGVLFCGNGSVALRRHDSGRVTIEGTLCHEYYVVRELLYDQYAIV